MNAGNGSRNGSGETGFQKVSAVESHFLISSLWKVGTVLYGTLMSVNSWHWSQIRRGFL